MNEGGYGDIKKNSEPNHMSNSLENNKNLNFSSDENEKEKKKNVSPSSDLIESETNTSDKQANKVNDSANIDITNNYNQNDGNYLPVSNNDNAEFVLPDTTIVLETDWGSKVYLVGTAHFSEQSQEDVAKVIRAVQPNSVVLELCESRSYMLQWKEEKILKIAEKMEFKMVKETIQNYGLQQGALYLLLLSVSAQITRELGMAPGGEFRRAYKEAVNVPGCVVHLGDRPIEITLRRAFASLSWWQSIKFAFYVIFKDIEKCKNRDYLEEMLAMLGGEFPELKNVFVNERDLFLSHSLVMASIMTNSAEEASILGLALYGVHKIASKSEYYSSLFR
ncbi:conserved hypothetical protein [Pediculus humanus corporis]|uniref:TraB domain-containing protein n=1 Tax=Pediculus humanus subsp. corporis TaxID=121224 RepID=E0VQR6_PEDHC|nr:uncharacterized protein Phum_PHUM381560 [Pediculus humanus corporis]EEB15721.1 conserved hypothetical protein [Pediculus humanus corporis]